MTTSEHAIASVAARKVQEMFQGAGPGDMLRIRGLIDEEIPSLVDQLEGWRPVAGGPEVKVIVMADEPWEGLSDDHLLPPNASATTFRNGGQPCIFVEYDAYSDAQGLRNVRSITDTELLEDQPHRHHLTKVLRSDATVQAPQLLLDVLEKVYQSFLRGGHRQTPPVRRWARFVERVSKALADDVILSAPRIWAAVGESLPSLQLFPDDRLPDESETKRGRLLTRNVDQATRLVIDGRDRDVDELLDKVEGVTFEEPDGAETPPERSEELKAGFKRLLRAYETPSLDGLWLRYWEQVESKRSKRKGLGERVREVVTDKAPDRLEELDELNVIDGLDERDQDAAIDFLDAPPEHEDEPRFGMLVDSRLRSAIAKVADPPQKATRTPLRKLLQEVHAALARVEEEGREGVLRFERRQRKAADDTLSAALFAWLFGPTLQRVQEATQDFDVCFQIDDSLCDAEPLHEFFRQADDTTDDEELDAEWAVLRLQLRWADDQTIESAFEWRPKSAWGLVAFARLLHHPHLVTWSGPEEATFDDWLEASSEPAPMIGGQEPEVDDASIASWRTLRREAFEALLPGLEIDALEAYSQHWGTLLQRVRQEHVHEGESDSVVEQLLEFDLFKADTGETALLATHPIRVRWIHRHLHNLSRFLIGAFRGALSLNPVNEAFFFRHLQRVTPHAQPSVLVVDDRHQIAVREQDWHEHFDVLRDQSGERTDWLAELDDGAVDEIADVVIRYVDAYPHKADGLHLLYMVRRRGARSLQRLLKRTIRKVSRHARQTLSVTLTLFIDPDEVREVEGALQEFDQPDHRADSDFPPVRVLLHTWDPERERTPDLEDVSQDIDIAIVPNLFGSRSRTRDSTLDEREAEEDFDPWLDEPTRIQPGARGFRRSTSVSRKMLPVGKDDMLEAWSTLNVRQFRRRPVSGSPGPHDVDYFELQVAFGESSEFFEALHEAAHWVITVDAFVGREQIDALESSPDVVLVKTGVGNSDAYRMVVSSSSGRQFVVNRLARRLEEQLPQTLEADVDQLALELYERARLLVPGIVLRSLGLGRTAAEMVGVVAARARVDGQYPVSLGGNGFEAWISLDEHVDWFGGIRRPRADLARIVGRWRADQLELDVLVVEAKLRKQVDVSRADGQIQQSVELLQAALAPGDDYQDADVWRRVILQAIEQASVRPSDRRAALRIHVNGDVRATLDSRMRGALRSGQVEVNSVEGVLVTLADVGPVDDTETPAGFPWLRMAIPELGQLLEALVDQDTYQDEPQPEPTRPEPTTKDDAEQTASRDSHGDQPEKQDSDTSSRAETSPSRHLLERYQLLISVLSEHDVEVEPVDDEPCVEGPGFYVFRIALGHGVRPSEVHKRTEELKYGLELDSGHEARTYTDKGAVVVEVPKREEERYYVDAEDLWERTTWPGDRLYAPLGADVRDEVVGIDFSSSKSPHLLIGGMTGGGKSVALETLLWGLIEHYPTEALKLWLVDPKGTEFVQFEKVPHVRTPIGWDAEDAIHLLEEGVEEMERRYKKMKELSRERGSRIRDMAEYNEIVGEADRFAWIVVVLDEFADLTADRESKKEIEALLQRLAQKARACGIHVIVATQKPTADVISTTTRSNLGAQLALRVRSASDSRVIMEAGGAESLAGNGDAFLRLSGTEPVRLQCGKVTTT